VRGLKPGDTLFIRAGTYVGSSKLGEIPSGDSWERPVTIKSYSGERPTLVPEPKETALYITGTKHVIIDGLVIDAKGGHDGIMHEFELRAVAEVANPFKDPLLVGEFVAPSGRTNTTKGDWVLLLKP
jgi:hypothetical protein